MKFSFLTTALLTTVFLTLFALTPSVVHCLEPESQEREAPEPAVRTNRTVISKGLIYTTHTHTKTVSDYSRLSNLVRSYPSTIQIHSIRMNPEYFTMAIGDAFTSGRGKRRATVSDIVSGHKALGGINAGFFDEFSKPLGLHIHKGKSFSRYSMKHKTSAAIFFKKENTYNIINNRCYLEYYVNNKPPTPMLEAVQSYPLLVANSKVQWDWRPGEGIAPRTAIGISWSGKVILVVTDTNPLNGLSLSELATFMAVTHKCKLALNLDGGKSSQMYYHDSNHTISVEGQDLVRTALLIYPQPPEKSAK